MAESWVVNSSPLIALGRIGRLHLLPGLAGEVLVPTAVHSEVRRVDDAAGASLSSPDFKVIDAPLDPVVGQWGLGPGETAVLSLARQRNSTAVVDDLAARRCASSLRIPIRGTVGVVLLAKSRSMISSVNEVLIELRGAGFYISGAVVADALALAGEAGDARD